MSRKGWRERGWREEEEGVEGGEEEGHTWSKHDDQTLS